MSNKKKKLKKPLTRASKTTVGIETPTFSIVKVRWEDHFSGNAGWSLIDSLRTNPHINVTVGIKVAEDKKTMTLAQNMGENMAVADTTTILKNCIVDEENLGAITYGIKE